MVTKKLFENFATAVDTFDFRLRKNSKYHTYVLELEAFAKGEKVMERSIILGTENVEMAVTRAMKVINDFARHVAPGLKIVGDVPAETAPTPKPEAPKGIRLVSLNDFPEDDDDWYDDDDDDCCCCCEQEDEVEEFEKAVDAFIDTAVVLGKVLKKAVR